MSEFTSECRCRLMNPSDRTRTLFHGRIAYTAVDRCASYFVTAATADRSKVGRFDDWPMILIDVDTREGIVGRSYLEPYLKMRWGASFRSFERLARRNGQANCAARIFQSNRESQNLVGYEGIAMIAVSGIDMAIWDALAKAAGCRWRVCSAGQWAPCRPTTVTACG